VDGKEAQSIKQKGLESNQDLSADRRRSLMKKQESVMMDARELSR